jgi:Osmosensitive K+ channel histidine kinase
MTEDYKRPDPDELLAQIQREEQQHTRGKLKIFMGYAAGVGKTFSMLEAAHQRKTEGVDVVIAYVETHGRVETEALVKGLEIIPRRQVEYHGVALTEMDVDAVLARKPQLALVDEFAHTNAPGSRHPKRYQDVEELLDAGINVYTTFNIQHLESLNDIVHQITDITVRETIPDDVVNKASEIELIDLPPEELLQRLKEGKVYIPEQASRAMEKFFRKGNLTALRELSMRRAADRVDDQMLDYMETRAISGPWPASEHLMVLISSHPLSERLVRAGRRLSEELNAEWNVVYIETPDRVRFSPTHSERVRRTLQLAEELGAKVFTISGRSVPETAIEFAKKHNVTKIIAGKPLRSRWSEIIQGSIVDEIIRKSGTIDVYIISDQHGPINKGIPEAWRPHRNFRRYVEAVLFVGIVTAVALPVESFIDPPNLVMLYLLAVVISALFCGPRAITAGIDSKRIGL